MFSIVEMVVVLVAAALLTVQTIREDVVKRRATLLSAEGQNEAVINTALGDWVTNNYASLVAQLVAPGPTTVTPPTIDDLFTAGNLKQPHANGPFWGGTYVIQMSVGPEGCSTAPGGCHVTYVMYPSLPLMRQGQPDVDGASQIAQAGGNSFGFSKMQNSATITGLNGAWHATNPLPGTPAAAVLATNGPTSDGNSVYIRRDGTLTWTGNQDVNGVDLDNVGNLYSTGTVQARNLNSVNGGQTTTVANDGAGNTDVSQSGAMQVMNAAKTGFAPLNAGAITSSSTITPGAVAPPNTSCTTNGASALNTDNSGQWLVCLNHVWTPMSGPLTAQQMYPVSYGSYVPAPACSAGSAPKIVLATQNLYVDNTATVNWVTSGSGPWNVYSVDGNGSPISAVGMAVTYCAS